jgi:hypothetical protein
LQGEVIIVTGGGRLGLGGGHDKNIFRIKTEPPITSKFRETTNTTIELQRWRMELACCSVRC